MPLLSLNEVDMIDRWTVIGEEGESIGGEEGERKGGEGESKNKITVSIISIVVQVEV